MMPHHIHREGNYTKLRVTVGHLKILPTPEFWVKLNLLCKCGKSKLASCQMGGNISKFSLNSKVQKANRIGPQPQASQSSPVWIYWTYLAFFGGYKNFPIHFQYNKHLVSSCPKYLLATNINCQTRVNHVPCVPGHRINPTAWGKTAFLKARGRFKWSSSNKSPRDLQRLLLHQLFAT